MDCIQLENGLDRLIKHEEIANDNGAGSPGNDPSNDGNPGSGSSNHDAQKLPKSEESTTHTRGRNRNSGNSTAAVNTNTSNASLAVDNSLGTVSEEHIISTPVVQTTSGRKGHKRKAKHHDNDDNATAAKVLPVGVALNMPTAAETVVADEHAESSVKDLENAMSKHLPSPINNNNNNSTNSNNNNTTTDFSTDSLLKQQQQQQQQDKGSTIQWIGGHHNPFQQTAPMPATALLRQLYANRESVIRATARQATNGPYYSGNFQRMFSDSIL